MSTRTNTTLIAAALTAAALTLSARAEPPDATAPQGQATAPHGQAKAHAAKEDSLTAKPAPTPDNHWWATERALDDGYAWPLPSASRHATSAPAERDDER
jgi:hypothetical protein